VDLHPETDSRLAHAVIARGSRPEELAELGGACSSPAAEAARESKDKCEGTAEFRRKPKLEWQDRRPAK